MNYEQIFIGRTDEINAFRSALEGQVRYWVLALPGPGGIGKTKLLRQMVNICQQYDVPHSDLVDFYYTNLQTKTGLLSELSSRLGSQNFPELSQALELSGAGPAALREEMLTIAVKRFISGFSQLASERSVVLFFDTFEKATETGVAEWFLSDVLPEMENQAIVVLAGRNDFLLGDEEHKPADDEEDEAEETYDPAVIPLAEESICLLPIEPFSLSDVKKYLREYLTQRGEGEVQLRVDPERYVDLEEPPAEVSIIWSRSEGHPVIVALAADWLAEWGAGSLMDVEDLSSEQFKQRMVSKVRDLESPEDEAIVRMAHVYHRFDAEVLDAVYPELREDGFDPERVIQNLSRLSFVKYWPKSGICLLHDEMQRLVEKYVWDEIDPVKEVRREISANAVKYYDEQLETEEDDRARWVLEAERIYHLLYNELEEGRPVFWHTADWAWTQYKLDFVTMLLSAAREANAKLGDPLLGIMCDLIEAWVKIEEWDLEEAQRLVKTVLQHPSCTERIRASALSAWGVYADRTGESDLAVERYNEALRLYRELESRLEQGEAMPTEHGVPQLSGVRVEISELLNRIGIAFRRKGMLDEAVAYYDQAQEVAREEKNWEWLAAALNNRANIERLRGNLQLARSLCKQALRYRERLHEEHRGVAYLQDVGLSHLTLGLVQRDLGEYNQAQTHFEEAEEMFERIRFRLGLVWSARNQGWVSYLRGKSVDDENERQRLFSEALSHYDRSRKVCKEFDIELELPNLLNKIGIAQRAMGNLEKAQEAFATSLRLGREHKDNPFIANSLVRLAEMAYASNDLEQVEAYADELRKFQEQDFHFDLAFAEMEELLAWVALDAGEFEKAFEHVGRNYAHLARLNRWRFDRKIDDLRDFFEALPDAEWERRCAHQLIEFWEGQGLVEEYVDLTAICEEYIMGDI